MLRINEYHIEPGTYTHQNGSVFVVVDLINHQWNATAQLHEALPDPLVVYRPLEEVTKTKHVRNVVPLSLFKTLFTKTK